MNSWTLVGFAKYVETKTTSTGKNKVQMQVSTQEGTKENPKWVRHKVICWENPVAEGIKDGEQVICHGRAMTDEWTDKEGQKKTLHYLLASSIGKCKDGKVSGGMTDSGKAPQGRKAYGEQQTMLDEPNDISF